MADIRPFIASRYAPSLVGELDRLLTPPYDVITPAMQEGFYKSHPKNLVRVDFGKGEPGDGEGSNRYTRSAALWKQWNADGTFLRDERPAIYVYEQEFTLPDGERVKRRGMFCAVRLRGFDEGGVRAHEHTFDGPKADRLNLTRATGCNISPIFCIYNDAERAADTLLASAIAGTEPIETTIDGVVHRLWTVADEGVTAKVTAAMKPHELYIADGHHRYETALNYRALRREETGRAGGDEPFDYTMMFLANTHDPGMVILPTHRVFSKKALAHRPAADVLRDLSVAFAMRELDVDLNSKLAPMELTGELQEAGREATAFVLLLPGERPRLLELHRGFDLSDLIPDRDIPDAVKALDVTLLHTYIIYRVWLECPEDEELDDSEVTYVKDAADALRMAAAGECAAGFLLNATKMEQVIEVAGLGMRMPHKSTYFYPKIITGMVIRDMDQV